MRKLDPFQVRQQIEALKATHPDIWDEGDDKLLLDCLEAETDLKEFLTVVEDRRQEAAHTAGAIASRIAELELRQKRYERREQAMRDLAFKLMTAADVRKMPLDIATLSISNGGAKLVISDEASVPDIFCRIKREPDKTKIKAAIEGGNPLNWAALVPGEPHLTVRVR